MKKLFTMILLLSISLPALAEEQTLSCTLKYVSSSIAEWTKLYKFDPIKKTFLNANYDDNDRLIGFRAELGAYVDETTMGYGRVTISRIDGSYKRLNRDGSLYVTGTCVVVKNAF